MRNLVYAYGMALNKRSLNLLLATGLICIAGGAFLLLCMFAGESLTTPILIPVMALAAGVFMLFYAFTRYKSVWTVFLGYFLTASCFFIMISGSDMTSHSLSQLWPVLAIICGAAYLSAGLSVHKKFMLSNAICSVFMMGMGVFFLLFSMDIITVPFSAFASRWWPLLLIIFGLVLIIVFIYKQNSDAGKATIIYDDTIEP